MNRWLDETVVLQEKKPLHADEAINICFYYDPSLTILLEVR